MRKMPTETCWTLLSHSSFLIAATGQVVRRIPLLPLCTQQCGSICWSPSTCGLLEYWWRDSAVWRVPLRPRNLATQACANIVPSNELSCLACRLNSELLAVWWIPLQQEKAGIDPSDAPGKCLLEGQHAWQWAADFNCMHSALWWSPLRPVLWLTLKLQTSMRVRHSN